MSHPRAELCALALLAAAACESPTRPSITPSHAQVSEAASNVPLAPYVAQDLGTPAGFDNSLAVANNDFGAILGQAVDASGSTHVFLYTHRWRDLGGLQETNNLLPAALNNRGHVVGFGILGQDTAEVPFVWTRKHRMRRLPSLLGAAFTDAEAINDRDEIVGCASAPDGLLHLVRWRSPQAPIEDLGAGPSGGACAAAGAINIEGEIGLDLNPFGLSQAGYYDGSFHAVPLPPGTASSSAIGLNLEGVILGAARGGAAGAVVFLWTQRRGVQLVPFLPGDHADAAAQINLFSAVVGFSVVSRTPGACFHPWVWAPGLATPRLLPLLTGFHPEASCSAFARTQNINDLGVVVGFGSTAQGQTHAIRWIPKPGDPDARAFMARPE